MVSKIQQSTIYFRALPLSYAIILFLFSQMALTLESVPSPSGSIAGVTPQSGFSHLGGVGGDNYFMKKDGNYLYVGEGGFLSIFDISAPSNPTRMGSVKLYAGVFDIEIVGTIAYATMGSPYQSPSYLAIIDVSQAYAPELLTLLEVDKWISTVAIRNGYAYLVGFDLNTFSSYIYVVNVTEPTAPFIHRTQNFPFPTIMVGGRIYGDILYLCGSGMRLYDVADPGSLRLLGDFSTWNNNRDGLSDIKIRGDFAFTSIVENMDPWEGAGLQIVNISDPTDPQPVSSFRFGDSWTSWGLTLVDDYALVHLHSGSDNALRLGVVDISNPYAPSFVADYRGIGYREGFGLETSGSVLFAAGDSGLGTWDISNIHQPVNLRLFQGNAYSLTTKDSLAFMANAGGLIVIDTAQSESPSEIGGYILPEQRISNVALSGNYACIHSGSTSELMIFDISEPTNPVRMAVLGGFHNVAGIEMNEALVFVLEEDNGLRVLDVTSPETPLPVGGTSISNTGTSLTVSGAYAYVGTNSGVRIYDVAVPSTPILVANISIPESEVTDIQVQQNLALIATRGAGLWILDVSDPTSPLVLGIYESADTHAVALHGSVAICAQDGGALFAIDVSNPVLPKLIDSSPFLIPDVGKIELCNGYYCLAARSGGLQIIQYSQPTPCDFAQQINSEVSVIESLVQVWGIDANGDGNVDVLDADWENWDLDGDGLPDSFSLALLAVAVCSEGQHYRPELADSFRHNQSLFLTENPHLASEMPYLMAALLTVSAENIAILRNAGVVGDGPYAPYTDFGKAPWEPLSADGDFDGDGVTNLQEAINVYLWGGSIEDFVRAATDPNWQGEEIPMYSVSTIGLCITLFFFVFFGFLIISHSRYKGQSIC